MIPLTTQIEAAQYVVDNLAPTRVAGQKVVRIVPNPPLQVTIVLESGRQLIATGLLAQEILKREATDGTNPS